MEMTAIRRTSIGTVESHGAAVLELANSAKEVLGYSVLSKLTKSMEESVLTPLQQALKSVDIDILDLNDVKRYQRERIIEETIVRCKKWMSDAAAEDSPSAFSGPGWYEEKIEEYREPVPEFVLHKAVQIKKAFPDCVITIESLREHPDPFLVVKIPNAQYPSWGTPREKYYVEVWAEPKFEGKFTAPTVAEDDLPF